MVKRVNGQVEAEFGGRFMHARGAIKVKCHLMFGILVVAIDQIVRLEPSTPAPARPTVTAMPLLGQFRASLAGRVHFILIDYPDWPEMLASTFDFDALVDACASQIIDACGDAPIFLAAYSFGGCVAFETARRLIQSKYRVHFLGLLDALTPCSTIKFSLVEE